MVFCVRAISLVCCYLPCVLFVQQCNCWYICFELGFECFSFCFFVAGCEGGQYNVVVAAVVEVVKRDFLVSCTRKKEVPLWKSRQNFGGKKVVRAGFRRKKVVSLLPSVVLEAVGTEETHSLLEGERDT